MLNLRTLSCWLFFGIEALKLQLLEKVLQLLDVIALPKTTS